MIPGSKTEQYKSSFIVRTVADWSKLEDNVVTADTAVSYTHLTLPTKIGV